MHTDNTQLVCPVRYTLTLCLSLSLSTPSIQTAFLPVQFCVPLVIPQVCASIEPVLQARQNTLHVLSGSLLVKLCAFTASSPHQSVLP